MDSLSIDFGTSFCAASYLDADGDPCPVCFGYNQYNARCYKLPTVIQYALTSKGEERKIIGESALYNLTQSRYLDSSIVSKIKTELREKNGYVINGKPKGSKIIISDILSYIKDIAEKSSNRQFTHLILTHPAQYETVKIRLLEDAAALCGFTSITLIEEPKAAAYAFIKKNQIPNQKGAIVFDYGGGTVDIAYLWMENSDNIQFKFQPVGKEQCGGEYIDLDLHNHFYKFFYPDKESQISPILMELCTRMKIGFGFKDIQDLALNQRAITIHRDEFEKIIYGKISIALNLLDDVVRRCTDNSLPIDYVFLNGGSSRLKIINDAIAAAIPDAKLLRYNEDDIAVAIGALLSVKHDLKGNKNTHNNGVVTFDSSLTKIRERFKNSIKQ